MRHCRFASIHRKLWLINGAEEQRGESRVWIIIIVFLFIYFYFFAAQRQLTGSGHGCYRNMSDLGSVMPLNASFFQFTVAFRARPNASPALPAITDLKASGNGRYLCHFVAVNIADTEIVSILKKTKQNTEAASIFIAEPRQFEPERVRRVLSDS